MTKKKQIYYLQIHLAVLLFGGAGLFGKLINAQAGAIVLARAALAALFLLSLKKAFKDQYRTKKRSDKISFFLLGAILAFHWTAFFHSIQLSTVAIGVLTFSTFHIFTILLEALFLKVPLIIKNITLGLLAAIGVYLIVPQGEISLNYLHGIIWGLASGASFAVLTLLNKKLISNYSPNTVSFYQNAYAALFLLPFFGRELMETSAKDWILLTILGIFFTGIAHTLFIGSMRGLKAQTASLIASLEPVYGILLAWLILNETPNTRALLGGVIILGVALIASLKKD